MEVLLEPGQGREFKMTMKQGAQVQFDWSTDWGVVNFDLHGDPPNPPVGFYHGYSKGTGRAADKGELIAAFDGIHGWFWENPNPKLVTITLTTAGFYSTAQEFRDNDSSFHSLRDAR